MNEFLSRFARFGVLHREETKNDRLLLQRLIVHGFVRRVSRRRKIFYELIEKALPLLEAQRKILCEKARIESLLHKSPSIYHALLGDIRFVDERHRDAAHFQFLGDWQLQQPVVPSQLELSLSRYYRERA